MFFKKLHILEYHERAFGTKISKYSSIIPLQSIQVHGVLIKINHSLK